MTCEVARTLDTEWFCPSPSKAQVLSEGVPLLTRGKAYEVSSRLFADASALLRRFPSLKGAGNR